MEMPGDWAPSMTELLGATEYVNLMAGIHPRPTVSIGAPALRCTTPTPRPEPDASKWDIELLFRLAD